MRFTLHIEATTNGNNKVLATGMTQNLSVRKNDLGVDTTWHRSFL
jgi:hypothetical protein